MQNKSNRPIAIDLFAGAGGMTLGFEKAGFDVLASVEIDPVHCAVHEFNFPFWSILCQDIAQTKAEDIRSRSAIQNKEIDVVFGGPPCQGFSLIGKRMLDDPRNSLVFHFIRLVTELEPKYFVFENVKGMTVGKHQKIIIEIIEKFKSVGYQVQEKIKVLNTANYGIPQNRERLFLLGCRHGFEIPNYPIKITQPAKRKKNIADVDLPISPTVWDALQDLPEIENYPQLYEQDWVYAEFGKPSDYAKILRGLDIIENDYSYQRKYDPWILTSSSRTKHNLESIARFKFTPPGKIEPVSRFHKLDPEGISHTLRAGTASNRGAFTSPRPIHPHIPRCITVREAARLHSYPDWFRFHVTKWHGFRQIGNSVPPLLAKAVASEIMSLLYISPAKPQIIQELGDISWLIYSMSKACKHYSVNPHIIEPRSRNSSKNKHEKL